MFGGQPRDALVEMRLHLDFNQPFNDHFNFIASITDTLKCRARVNHKELTLGADKATLVVPKRTRWFEGPHMVKCLASVLSLLRDKDQRDKLVVLAKRSSIEKHIVDAVAKSFHPFLRRPIRLLVEMLQFCGHVTLVEDSADEPVVVGRTVAGQWPSQPLENFGIEMQKQMSTLHAMDQALWRKSAPLFSISATDSATESPSVHNIVGLLQLVLDALGQTAGPESASQWSLANLQDLVRTSRFRIAEVTGVTMSLLNDTEGRSLYLADDTRRGPATAELCASLRQAYKRLHTIAQEHAY